MPARIPEEELAGRILARTVPDGDCLVWQGCRSKSGYGTVRFRKTTALVHRVIWTLTVDEIPPGLTIDHLCYNPPCVNVKHMRVVTVEENSRGSRGSQVTKAIRSGKTHCKNGHEYTPENTLVRTIGRNPGTRVCRACNAEYDARSKAKKPKHPRVPKPCPSEAAYNRHLMRGEVCQPCRDVHARAVAERRRHREAS